MTDDPARAGEDQAAGRALLELLGGRTVAQAVSTAAAIGLPEALGDEALAVDALAGRIGCEADRLGRLVSVLVGVGALTRGRDDRVALTALGRALRQDRLGALAAFLGEPAQWDPWARLRDALAGGPSAFERTHGAPLFVHYAKDPAGAARYDRAVDAFTRQEAAALAGAMDFTAGGTLVDVGGGRGALLTAVLRRWPALHGVLYDLPHVAGRSEPALKAALGDRVRAEGGDFHAGVPEGGDYYVLRHVLHNWDDDRAGRLLARCGDALRPGGAVLVIEGVLLPGDRLDTTRLLDLEMMVLTGAGRERSKPELRRLFRGAGLKLVRSVPLFGFSRLFVAEAVS